MELIEHGRELLEDVVQKILGVSTRTGESVFTLSDDPLENAQLRA